MLADLLSRRRQLVENCVQEKLRSRSAASKEVQKSLQEHIDWLERRITQIDDELEQRLRASTAWQVKEDLLRGIPGMG
jgi:transposase